ncbi:hypothetical protein [Acetobacter okinawensis]|uniref:hypothetical protein n=1 Tax=Acetobacter okinawensis TaxID=1076594 RepID=UPI0004729E49|nr:hypothetical protein [Acetobacter okinawensis]MBS0966089.1 hypothetical protein [Acetobacter okinawensis]
MHRTPVYLTDLAASERLTLWTIRRLAGAPPACGAAPGASGSLFLPCFRQEFMAVSQAFQDALTDMAAHEMPALDICAGSTLAVTETEYNLLLATEAAQNERETDMQALLRPLLPFARLRQRMMAALTTLGACLAGAGYWLSHHAARPLQQPVATAALNRAAYPATAALSVARWHDLDMSMAHSWRHTAPRHSFAPRSAG